MPIFFLLLFAFSCVVADIVPTRTLHSIENHLIDEETWVVFDVDMTLIVPVEPILWGSFYDGFIAMARRAIPDFGIRDRKYYRNIIMNDAEYMLIDPSSKELIASLQRRGANVIALTALEFEFADWRLNQLKNLGIDFSKGPASDFYCYKEGILFSDNLSKGDVLVDFFNYHGIRPKRVIFFDDAMKFLKSVDSALEKEGILVTCYHYQEMDYRPIQFVPAEVYQKMDILYREGRWNLHD